MPTARSRDGAEIALAPAALADLGAGLRGTLLTPGEAGYDDGRAVWNAMIDRRPAVVARCLGVADVAACVRFARAHGLVLSVKGGGHNISGLAVCDGGMALDLSRMRGVWVDPERRTARVQGGCLLGDVDRETQLHGLAAALGFISTTGVAGLTLGGGFGYLTRRAGWSCDGVRSMEVVAADGRVVRAGATENPDLLWALRGGGGNFGVVTSFEYDLHPVGPEILGGVVAWRADAADDVLATYRTLIREAPPELTCVAVLRRAPPAPWLPQAIHGQPIVALLVCHSGSIQDARPFAERITGVGAPVGDILRSRSYASQQSLLDATQPGGRRNYWKSEYLPALPGEMLTAVLAHAERMVSPHAAIILFPIDGALGRLPADHSAVGNRDAAMVLTILTAWERAEDDAANIGWARAAWQDLRRFSTGGTYVNFLTEEEGEERIRAAYGPNFERLAAVKSAWDPDNLFRMTKNIPPGRPAGGG
jgi:FAD/FMN-containing dehydrogenase